LLLCCEWLQQRERPFSASWFRCWERNWRSRKSTAVDPNPNLNHGPLSSPRMLRMGGMDISSAISFRKTLDFSKLFPFPIFSISYNFLYSGGRASLLQQPYPRGYKRADDSPPYNPNPHQTSNPRSPRCPPNKHFNPNRIKSSFLHGWPDHHSAASRQKHHPPVPSVPASSLYRRLYWAPVPPNLVPPPSPVAESRFRHHEAPGTFNVENPAREPTQSMLDVRVSYFGR
jgi:hypothetical protein